MPFGVLLVDEQRILRDGIKAILARTDDMRVTSEAGTGTDAVQICQGSKPDLVLMEVGLPGLNGIETTREILRYSPKTKVVILSMYNDEHSVVGAIRAGARGYVVKNVSADDLIDALRTVAGGGSYLSPQVSDRLLHRIQRGGVELKSAESGLAELSPREQQVLRMVAEGKTSKDIAVLLDLGLQTVRSYRKTMMKKLNVNNVAGLTQFALAVGVTQLAPPYDLQRHQLEEATPENPRADSVHGKTRS